MNRKATGKIVSTSAAVTHCGSAECRWTEASAPQSVARVRWTAREQCAIGRHGQDDEGQRQLNPWLPYRY